MIEIIGLTTFCLLIGVLASAMATESAAERRRVAMVVAADRLNVAKSARRKTVSSI